VELVQRQAADHVQPELDALLVAALKEDDAEDVDEQVGPQLAVRGTSSKQTNRFDTWHLQGGSVTRNFGTKCNTD
jgi:hypothetical protein